MIQNPILSGFNPDPSFLRVGNDFYIATSTFEWFPGVQIHHSRDLRHWRLLGRPLERVEQLDLRGVPDSGGVWAPCLSHCDGTFHLVYTNVVQRDRLGMDMHNSLVTAPSPEGPWSDPTHLVSGGFDPSLFHDDGRKWLVWCYQDTRPRPNKADKMRVFGGIALQEYDPEAMRMSGPRTIIFEGTDLGATEGPHLYKRNGWYYLMTAEGGTGMDHAVTLARSRKIDGPYEVDPQNPMLTSRNNPQLRLAKAGHASLIHLEDGSPWLAHLCGRPVGEAEKGCLLGRETALQACKWSDDGWLRLRHGGNEPADTVPAPALTETTHPPPPTRDDFDSENLLPCYQSLRVPFTGDWCDLTSRPGWLRLKGWESPSSLIEQSLIGRRVEALPSTATLRMEFEPECYHQAAGLSAFYNTAHNHTLRISHDPELGKKLELLTTDKGRVSRPLGDGIPVDWHGAIYLRCSIDANSVRFAYSKDGTEWQECGGTLDTHILTDEYTMGFTGAFFALRAHDLSGLGHHADFDWLEVR